MITWRARAHNRAIPPHNRACRTNPHKPGTRRSPGIAGGLIVSFLSSHENSSALVVLQSEPVANRPRGAYCALAIASSNAWRDSEFVFVENSDSIEPVIELAFKMLARIDGPLGIACITDRQLMKIARELRDSASVSLRDRIYLIGYDGATDSNGELLIANSPIRVFGTVDTQAREQGRVIAAEILSVAAGLEPRQFLMSAPRAVRFLPGSRLDRLAQVQAGRPPRGVRALAFWWRGWPRALACSGVTRFCVACDR